MNNATKYEGVRVCVGSMWDMWGVGYGFMCSNHWKSKKQTSLQLEVDRQYLSTVEGCVLSLFLAASPWSSAYSEVFCGYMYKNCLYTIKRATTPQEGNHTPRGQPHPNIKANFSGQSQPWGKQLEVYTYAYSESCNGSRAIS